MNFASIPYARCLLASVLSLGAAAASAQPAAAPAAGASAAVAASAAAGGAEPYGAALEGYAYPHPVHLLPLDWDGLALRMAYMDVPPAGAASGETVLLMHGRNFPSSYWEGTIATLAGAGFRVVVPDQIHFGKSSKPDDRPASFDVMAAHTAALLDHLKLPAVHVVAHSMGGMAAMRFTRTFPARVKRLVLEAPVGLEDYRRYVPPVPRERLLAQEMALTPEGYLDQLMNTYRPQLPRERMRAYADVRARMMGSAEYPRWVRSYVSSYYAMWGQPVVHEMPLIAQPTLIVVGSRDRTATGRAFAPPELREKMGDFPVLAREAAARMPSARAEVFEGYGHMLHLEAPERFHRLVVEFLGEEGSIPAPESWTSATSMRAERGRRSSSTGSASSSRPGRSKSPSSRASGRRSGSPSGSPARRGHRCTCCRYSRFREGSSSARAEAA